MERTGQSGSIPARTINFVYDPLGINGKSAIASLMELQGKAVDLPAAVDAEKLIDLKRLCNIVCATQLQAWGFVCEYTPCYGQAQAWRHVRCDGVDQEG